MKQTHTRLSSICFPIAIAFLLFSCTADDKPKENSKKQDSKEISEPDELVENDEEFISGPVAIEKVQFKQASNGLENAVVEYYLDLYNKGELRSIVKGSSQKLDHEKNKVFLDTKLMAYDGLDFFRGKHPEFIVSTENVVTSPDNSLLENIRVNCEIFYDGSASDYLLNREDYNLGDLQLMISKAFYYEGAYYVHAWEINNSTSLFHNQRMTYKFDKNLEMVDHSGVNTAQLGYKAAKQYLKNQDMTEKEYMAMP